MRSVRCIVSGRVQGVFYRASTQRQAQSLGINGWVRNLPDGRVEVFAGGEEGDLRRFLDWLAVGPSAAEVTGIEMTEAVDLPPAGFEVR